MLTLDAGLWMRRACGWVACMDALCADVLGMEACKWVVSVKIKIKKLTWVVSIDTQRGDGKR